MNQLKLQTPNPDNAIPLFGEVKAHRLKIENDKQVDVCIKSDLLLTKKFYQLLTTVLADTKELEKNMDLLARKEDFNLSYKEVKPLLDDELKKRNYDSVPEADKEKMVDEVIQEIFEKTNLEKREKIVAEIENLSHRIEESIDEFEVTERLNRGQLVFVESARFFMCRKCLRITTKNLFKKVICPCGEKIDGHSSCKELNIIKMGEPVMHFVTQNWWLEYGVNQILVKMGYETSCGCHLVGTSGVSHEIDVIAEKGKSRVLVECKAREIGVNDMLIFYGKMSDLGVLWGYVFTVDGSVSPEVKKIAKSKNIIIVENILLTNKQDIENKIKELEKVLSA